MAKWSAPGAEPPSGPSFPSGPRRFPALPTLPTWLSPDLASLVALAVIAWLYLQRLMVWLIGDDEGSYLYAAWRMSRGEAPYRDFLTPQLPAFLAPGGWLMAQAGPDVWTARVLATLATLAAGVCTWYAARRLFGPAVGLLAGVLLLLHPDVFLFGRTFRADPFMLFYATLGVACFVRAALPAQALAFRSLGSRAAAAEDAEAGGAAGRDSEHITPDKGSLRGTSQGRVQSASEPDPDGIRRGWLVASGAAFGLATLCKLFGPLPMAGCLLWLLVDGRRKQRPLSRIIVDGAILAGSAGLVVLAVVAYYFASSPAFFEATVGHHLRQGAGLTPWQVLMKGVAFYLVYLRQNGNALLVLVAVFSGVVAAATRDRRRLVFALQLPTLLAFLVLSRDAYERHVIYLLPAMATLFAAALWSLVQRERPLGVAILLAILAPWWLLDVDHAWRWETGTARLADFIQLVTAPDDIVFSDYSELNFYARRPTTYAAASLSAGAAGSGQITWRRLEGELAGKLPPLLVLDTDPSYAHLVFLRDRPAFLAWVKDHYGAPLGSFRRDSQRYEIFVPGGQLNRLADFDGGLSLLAGGAVDGEVLPQEDVDIRLAWQAGAPIADDFFASLRLVDADGRELAAADGAINASDPDDQLRVRPTSRWQAGEITTDRVTLRVPEGTPPGDYAVYAGIYGQGGAGEASSAAGQDLGLKSLAKATAPSLGRRIRVATVQVRPRWTASSPASWPAELRAAAGTGGAQDGNASGPQLLAVDVVPTATLNAGDTITVWSWWSVKPGDKDGACAGLWPDGHSPVASPDGSSVSSLPVVGSNPLAWSEGLAKAAAEDPTAKGKVVLVHVPVDVIVPGSFATGGYRVSVGQYADGSCTSRVAGGGPGEVSEPVVHVQGRDLDRVVRNLPALERTLDAQAATNLALAGVNGFTESIRAGETMTPTLVWQARRAGSALGGRQKVSVQLLCPDGQVCAQDDREPGQAEPTTAWVPGEVVLDPHPLTLPMDLAPGRYEVVAAMYNALTFARTSFQGADVRDGVIRLGTIEVR